MQSTKILNSIIFWLSQKRWLIIAAIIGAIFYVMPTPEGLTVEGYHILIIVVIAIFLIIFEPIPLPAIASAFAYLTIVASPTCMIIHSSGLVKSKDYLRAGWKMFIMSATILFFMSHMW